MGRWMLAVLISAFGLAVPSGSAQAVDIEMEVESTTAGVLCSGITAGVAACDATDLPSGEQVTVTLALDSQQNLNGYDLTFTWDDEELTLVSCENLYPDTQPGGTVPFLVSPCTANDPTGSDGITLSIVTFATTQLIQLTFELTAIPGCDTDGLADVSWSANGNGLSPGSVVLDNPAGASADLGVPVRACNDGLDNDNDGRIDFDGGVCAGLPPAQQTAADPQCGKPTKNKEANSCGLGIELVIALPLLAWGRRRQTRR